MTGEESPGEPRMRSLLVRTTLGLGLALAVTVVALLLVMKPFLAKAFESETGTLLVDQEQRARTAARDDTDHTEIMLQASTDQAFDSARAAVADAPIEMLVPDAETAQALRAALDKRLAENAAERLKAVEALRGELDERARARLEREWRELGARSSVRAREFGGSIAARAAAGMLALLAVLFLVHGWLLWRWVLAPVRHLVEATQEVAKGRLGTRIPVQGDDEVARLAQSFNKMTESLEKALDDLRALNATLEERVLQKSLEIERKERELRHADKMASLGTLAGGVAHEFNNLLGGIQGCAEDGARESDAEELRATLGMIERTARRGTAITQNLLRFARPSSGERRDVDLREVVRDVAALVEPEAARTKVKVVVETNGPAVAPADPSGLHQVLLNLATNAVHAMAEKGGTLTLRAERGTSEARLVVVDTGKGIPPEHRERLFEPFFSTRAEGTGLGLSVSWGIVHSHGGHIDVVSEPGRGSKFTVVLPAVAPGPSPAEPARTKGAKP